MLYYSMSEFTVYRMNQRRAWTPPHAVTHGMYSLQSLERVGALFSLLTGTYVCMCIHGDVLLLVCIEAHVN